MSLTIPSNSVVPSTNTSVTPSLDLANQALQVANSIAQLAQSLVGPQCHSPVPVQPGAPVDSFEGSYGAMDPGKAAQTVLAHFDAIEGVGVNASGKGAGDANIGRRELERVADSNSGFPPEVRAAAKWLLDHPTSARSIDQGASRAKGDSNEVHFSKEDLRAFVSSFPSTATASAGATAPSAPVSSSPATGTSAPAPASSPATGASGFEPSTRPLVDLGSLLSQLIPAQKPTEVYSAAQTLKDHFKFAEGVGMNEKGNGAGDNNIGVSELKRLADPQSGAPAEVRQAADFLLKHPTAMRSIDQGASKARGDANEVHISLQDLEAFTANAPAKKEFSGSLGVAQLARQLAIYG